ncbi:MAG: hypothetical protein ABL878_17980 [Burkholderiales bacterium]
MCKSCKYIISLMMALWLPINGYVALAMPFCQHGGADMPVPATMSAGDHSGMAHHADPASGSTHGADPCASTDPTGSGLACNDCGVCHLACSPLLMSETILFKPAGHNVFDVQVQPSLHSFSPEQPQRPPRAAL